VGLEYCRELDLEHGSFTDIKGDGYIIIKLINKAARYNRPIKAYDFRHWPRNTKVAKFLLVI
jgi:hypothetical protein